MSKSKQRWKLLSTEVTKAQRGESSSDNGTPRALPEYEETAKKFA
jgi:hypothetical protein